LGLGIRVLCFAFGVSAVRFSFFTRGSFHVDADKIRAKFGDIRCRKLRVAHGGDFSRRDGGVKRLGKLEGSNIQAPGGRSKL
jgi:hypothetical protein